MSRAKITIFIIGIFGIIFGAIGISDTIKIMNEDFVDLNEVKAEKLEIGDLAKGEIPAAYDQIAIQKTSRSYGFIPMGSSETPYYLVVINDHFGVLSAGNKDIQKQLDKLANQTWDYDDQKTTVQPTPVEVTTKVISMPDKVRQYLKDYCKEWGMTDEQYASFVDDSCVINCVQYDSMKMIPFIGFGIGIVFIAIFVILVVKGKKGSSRTTFVGEQPPYGGMQNTYGGMQNNSAPTEPTASSAPSQDSQDYMDSVDTTNYKDF